MTGSWAPVDQGQVQNEKLCFTHGPTTCPPGHIKAWSPHMPAPRTHLYFRTSIAGLGRPHPDKAFKNSGECVAALCRSGRLSLGIIDI